MPGIERLIRVKAHPDSSKDRLERRGADAYELWVRAPAERGLANEAVLRLLASTPELSGRRLRIVKGLRSPSKIISCV